MKKLRNMPRNKTKTKRLVILTREPTASDAIGRE